MKKLLTLTVIATAFVCFESAAQLQKGEKALGGTLSFTKSKSKNENGVSYVVENESTGVAISPNLSIGIGRNWIVGVALGYLYQKNEGSSSSRNTLKGFNAGGFARKFYPIGAGKFGLFGQGNVEYEHFKSESGNPGSNSIGNAIGVSVQPGAYLRASKRFIIETYVGSIGYSHLTGKPEEGSAWKSTANSFHFSLIDGLTLGFKIVL